MFTDKKRAIKHRHRISERNLWMIALLGGATGMTIGMKLIRHKTKHKAFAIGFPILALIQIGFVIFISQLIEGVIM